MRLYLHHISAAHQCRKGARVWFRARGWSWTDFLANGRPVEDFEATGDPLTERAVAEVYREAEHGR